ncbi:hypothetical protein SPHV1_230004 [Novosphingobium sp. KN65.2]|nr:hypothetical protein SPHV1_230004 [Novosphingobium sp. KN65.2]
MGAALIDERTKHIGDAVAMAGGGLGTLAQWADFAGQVTPILSMAFVGLSILWLFWRMVDRVRFGPARRDD